MAPARKNSSGITEKAVYDTNGPCSYRQNEVYVKGKSVDNSAGFLCNLFTKEYVTVEHVPEQYRERFLVKGYRQAHSSVLDCLVSTVRPNNETLNFWTHFIPFLILLAYFWHSFPCKLWPPIKVETMFYPLLSVEGSVCAYLLCSSLAHLFNCMTPRVRHICFYLDYAAISMYGIGGACATFYYLRSFRSGFLLFDSPNLFLSLASVWSVLACYINCASRHRWDRVKYKVRTLALSVPFLYGNLPTYYRFIECGLTGDECSYGLLYCFALWTCYLISAVLNATRVPERYYPSTFDIVGHNHQWVHVITTFGTVSHILAVFNDLTERREDLKIHFRQVTFLSSLGWTVVTAALTVAIAVWFGTQLTPSGHHRVKQKDL